MSYYNLVHAFSTYCYINSFVCNMKPMYFLCNNNVLCNSLPWIIFRISICSKCIFPWVSWFSYGDRSLPLHMIHSDFPLFLSLSLSLSCSLFPLLHFSFTVSHAKSRRYDFLSGTNFKSSESSWLSLAGVLIPLFLARGHPERLKTESMELIT